MSGGLVLFTLPVVTNGLVRRFCGVTSALVIKHIIKGGTLTTIKSTCALVAFLASVFPKLSVKTKILFSVCGKGGSGRTHK